MVFWGGKKLQFKKKCPLTGKNAPEVDYKNVKLLKRYTSENGKILPSRVTSVSQKKQRLHLGAGLLSTNTCRIQGKFQLILFVLESD